MLHLGLLSTARINREISRVAAVSDRVEIVAVASRDYRRAETYARENEIPRAHGSYDALLADPEVDAVYVPLPNALHHEWTMRALAANKHVLCEKPYSRLPGEVGEAFDRSEGAGLVLMEAFMYRHHPQTQIVADLVTSGAIGAPSLAKAELSFRLEDPADIRLRPELAGGSLMDVGCYCVSGLRLIAGEPDSATGEQRVGVTGTDTSFRGALRFPSGITGLFHCSFELPRRQELEVVGEDGRIRVGRPGESTGVVTSCSSGTGRSAGSTCPSPTRSPSSSTTSPRPSRGRYRPSSAARTRAARPARSTRSTALQNRARPYRSERRGARAARFCRPRSAKPRAPRSGRCR